MNSQEKSLWWLVPCWALGGFFGINKTFAHEYETFDPTTTLMGSDVRLTTITIEGTKTEMLMVKVKNPNECRGPK